METTRFGVSMKDSLLEKFDRLIEKKSYPNRSEAIRDLIRKAIVEDEWESSGEEAVTVFIMVFDHHRRELSRSLLRKEHSWSGEIMATLHIHLDHDNCLEAKIIRGNIKEVKEFCDNLTSMKGVKFGRMVPAATGRELA
ncbi:MAG: nickel-responsive transcriptional regulator NikR [Candidatus Krumholzibacteriales bacterium]